MSTKNDIFKRLDEIDTKIDNQKTETENYKSENQKLRSIVTEQGKLLQSVIKRLETCESKVDFHKCLLDENQKEVQQLQSDKRRHNLIIHGLKEENDTSPRQQVQNLFHDMGLPFDLEGTDAIYRIGRKPKQGQRPRPTVCELTRKYNKGEIYRRIKNLRDKPKWAKVSITDDLSPEENRKRQDMRDLCNLGKAQRRDIKLSGSTLILEGKRFTHRKIDQLPRSLNLANAKVIPCKDGLAFQGPLAFLSHMFACPITYDGQNHTSAEQAIVYQHATISGSLGVAAAVLQLDDPFRIKSLSKFIRKSEVWDNTNDDVILDIDFTKFQQIPTSPKNLLTQEMNPCMKPRWIHISRRASHSLKHASSTKNVRARTWLVKD